MARTIRIMVTDDDAVSLRAARLVLEKKGYEVVTAASGAECIESLKKEPVDILLLDVEMPGQNGIETLARIRKEESLSQLKVLFVTATPLRERFAEAFRLGALDFIRKPFLAEELSERIEKALLSRKARLLAVDDEPLNLMIVKRIFGIRYEVVLESSGEAALLRIGEQKPDALLLDLHMPGMNGMDVLVKLHQMEGCENIPVIFLTADEDKDTEVALFKAGASDCIRKPMVPEVAIQRVNRIIELKQTQDSLEDEVNRKTEELLAKNKKIRNLTNQIIYALAGAVDAKDTYTNGHSRRVAGYARELSIRMGYSKEATEDVYVAGLLHDIGKIGIPDTIINKTGRLTDAEFAVIKRHPKIGAEILEGISELPVLAIGARWHHERYDGHGYPDGLKGEEIPEIARIVCVADCYDAMTSNRSYRYALPQDVVRREIERGLGTQFDPRIAGLMLEMIDEDTEYRMCEQKEKG